MEASRLVCVVVVSYQEYSLTHTALRIHTPVLYFWCADVCASVCAPVHALCRASCCERESVVF